MSTFYTFHAEPYVTWEDNYNMITAIHMGKDLPEPEPHYNYIIKRTSYNKTDNTVNQCEIKVTDEAKAKALYKDLVDLDDTCNQIID